MSEVEEAARISKMHQAWILQAQPKHLLYHFMRRYLFKWTFLQTLEDEGGCCKYEKLVEGRVMLPKNTPPTHAYSHARRNSGRRTWMWYRRGNAQDTKETKENQIWSAVSHVSTSQKWYYCSEVVQGFKSFNKKDKKKGQEEEEEEG